MRTPIKIFLLSLMILNPLVGAASDATVSIIAAEQARRVALLSNDMTALANLLSDDLKYVHSTGKRENKQQVLAGLSSKQVAYERFELGGLDAREITADVGVLTGTIDQRRFGNGKWSEVKLLFQSVWRNEAGTWRLISMQTLQLPQSTSAPVASPTSSKPSGS